MKTNLVTQNHFAKMCGVSRQAIGKSVKAKNIKMVRGKVDLDHRMTCEYYYSKTGKQLKPDAKPAKKNTSVKITRKKKEKLPEVKEPKKSKPPKTEPEQITAPIVIDDDDDGFSLPPGIKTLDDINAENLHLLPHDFIKKMKDMEAALKTKTTREEQLGTLIKRSTVRTVFGKLYTIDTNQWKTLEDRIAPEINQIYKFEEGSPEEVEVRKLISREVGKTLKYVKRLMDDFLIKNKEAGL